MDEYNIDLVVNTDNAFDVIETITAYFNVSKHGIFRIIPLRNEIVRLDGSISKNRAQISNVSVDATYTTYREGNDYVIKIGDSDKTLIGAHTYVIKYTYNLGKDSLKDVDELYYNLIGTEWDAPIGNVTFSIKMPKDFDNSKLGFASGVYGSTYNDKIEYQINDNLISGVYLGTLDIGEGLTVRCELPDGYFESINLNYNIEIYMMFLIPFISLIISFLFWIKCGKDNKVIETVEFYPPQGFNGLEVVFLYKGKADNKDVVSLIVYLANKGYIKISEIEKNLCFLDLKSLK